MGRRRGHNLTITVTRTAGAFPQVVTAVVLTAEDDDGRYATASLTLRGNDPPTADNNEDLDDIRLGLQTDELTTARTVGTDEWTCNTSHSCTASLMGLFNAPTGDTGDKLKYEATSGDETKVAVSVDGDMITITAMATTAETEGDMTTNGADQAVGVTIKATDAGGLSATSEDLFSVLVDSPPTLENPVVALRAPGRGWLQDR